MSQDPNVTPPVTPPTPPAAPVWTASLPPEMQTYVTGKGFKEPKDVLDSYINFEKLQGMPKERLLALPEKLEGEAMDPIWERLGAVKESKELAIELPKENFNGDEKMGEFVKETFHKLKVPRGMAEGFAKALNERQALILKTETEAHDFKVSQDYEAIKKEWGAAYQQNEAIANQAALKFGITKEEVAALGGMMGPAKAIKFLHKLGEGIGEATHITGNTSPTGQLAPAQAKAEIQSLMNDTDFGRRLNEGDAAATDKWNRLHVQASFAG